MNFIHLRKGRKQTKDEKGRKHVTYDPGAITIAYGFQEATAVIGVAFSSSQDQFNKRVGRSISKNRMLSNPLRVSAEVDITPTLITQAVRTILLDPPKWCLSEGLPANLTRFRWYWEAALLGPDGTVFTVGADGVPGQHQCEELSEWETTQAKEIARKKEQGLFYRLKEMHENGNGNDPRRGWVFRSIPQWAAEFILELS